MSFSADSAVPAALRFRRGAVVAAAGLSGLLVFVSMVVDPAPGTEGVEMVTGYAAFPFRSGLHTNLIHYGFALLAPVLYAIVGLVRARGAWLANAAALLTLVGLSALPGLFMTDFALVATYRAGGAESVAALEREMGALAWFTALAVPGLLCALLALPVAVIGLWRAGLVPWYLPVAAVVASAALQFAPVWWVGFGLNAVWLLVFAWFLARIPIERWYPEIHRGLTIDSPARNSGSSRSHGHSPRPRPEPRP